MKTTIPDDAEILAAFDATTRRPLHVSDVADRLGLPITARHPLNQALDAMASRGLLSPLPGSRYRLPKESTLELQGRFTQNPRGFGFVFAEDGGPDVYVPATSVRGAMHGDRVAVSAHVGPSGREGVVTRVVTRRPPRVPGVLRMKNHGAWVEPDDARIRGPIPMEDVGAAKDGEAVVCEILRWPEHGGELPIGRVRESLGRPGQLDVEVIKVLLREGVEETFPEATLAEAAALPQKLGPRDIQNREDVRDVPLVTIDPDDARDHDDAVYVRRNAEGGYTALVAIADVSAYVRPGTALDEAALARGTSIYLPDHAIPMLPPELSSHLASLLEGEDRLCLAVEVQLTAEAKIEKSRVFEGVMRCHAGLTYSTVAHALGWTALGKPSAQAEALRGDLEVAAELSELLRARRMRRGALDLDLPEARVRFAEDGKTPIDIVQSREDPGIKRAYSLIEELMLLANEVIAATCERKAVATIYRTHGGPEETGMAKLSAAARAYGFELDPEDAANPKKLSKFLRKIVGTPAARILGMILLRSLPQAVYQVENRGHFGLAAEAYLHFTSPIRRYPDVVAHRVVRQLARKEKVRDEAEAIQAMHAAAAENSRLERRAMEIEREVLDLYRCVVAEAHRGEVHAGTVSGLSASGPFVHLESPFIDVMVRVAELGHGEWELDALGLRLWNPRTGYNFTLGQELVVEIAEVSMPRRTVYARLPAEAARSLVGTAPRGAKTAGEKKDPRHGGTHKRGGGGGAKGGGAKGGGAKGGGAKGGSAGSKPRRRGK